MSNVYMHKLVEKFESKFNIEYNRKLGDFTFDFAGEFNQRSAKYMLIKEAEIYAFKNNEHVFYKNIDYKFNVDNINNVKFILNKNLDEILNMDEEHMASVITFIFSNSQSPDLDVQNAIKKFKFYKSFYFGFKGWVNVKLIFINSNTNDVITNKYAKGNEKFFRKIS